MIPLIDKGVYEDLLDRRRAIDDGTTPLAPVFVPVGPDPGAASPVRLLFVGQTAYEWEQDGEPVGAADPLPLEKAAEQYASTLQRLLVSNESPFWQGVRTISERVVRALGIGAMAEREKLSEIVAWSNLAKIHRIQEGAGNPPPKFIQQQQDVCVKSLRSEIHRAKPSAVVLLTGGAFGKEIISEVFGPDQTWWQNDAKSERVAGKWNADFETIVLWGNHPAAMRWHGTEREDIGFISGYVAGHLHDRV